MDVRFGVHAGLQHTSIAELRELWHRIEELGFDWISIWDHFYAADASGDPHCLEAVTSHTALAASTSRVTCGWLVYSAGYRHPAVLANAMATLEQVANGRVVLGLGGGWLQGEYDAYGLHFGTAGERLRMLAEYIQCVRGLLTQPRTTFDGEFFHLRDAQCEPKPVQPRLPIWVGGGGEKVTLRIAAEHADGWNVPFIGPELFAQKNQVLTQWCEKEHRTPGDVTRTVNLGLAIGRNEAEAQRKRDGLKEQFGAASSFLEPGMLIGTPQQVIDRIGTYVQGGAEWIIVALRAPFDLEGLQVFIDTVMPAFR